MDACQMGMTQNLDTISPDEVNDVFRNLEYSYQNSVSIEDQLVIIIDPIRIGEADQAVDNPIDENISHTVTAWYKAKTLVTFPFDATPLIPWSSTYPQRVCGPRPDTEIAFPFLAAAILSNNMYLSGFVIKLLFYISLLSGTPGNGGKIRVPEGT